jgi:hypothetical protein
MSFRGEVIAFVVLVVVVLLLPLLVFAPKLARAREEHLLFLSCSGYRGAGHLEGKLRASESGGLPTNEISGLADFGVLYENARLMRPLPLELRHIGAMVLAAALPFIPLVFLVMPAQEVLRTLARLII